MKLSKCPWRVENSCESPFMELFKRRSSYLWLLRNRGFSVRLMASQTTGGAEFHVGNEMVVFSEMRLALLVCKYFSRVLLRDGAALLKREINISERAPSWALQASVVGRVLLREPLRWALQVLDRVEKNF